MFPRHPCTPVPLLELEHWQLQPQPRRQRQAQVLRGGGQVPQPLAVCEASAPGNLPYVSPYNITPTNKHIGNAPFQKGTCRGPCLTLVVPLCGLGPSRV